MSQVKNIIEEALESEEREEVLYREEASNADIPQERMIYEQLAHRKREQRSELQDWLLHLNAVECVSHHLRFENNQIESVEL